MTTSILDLATFRSLQDTAGVDFTKELVGTFLEEAPPMLDELRAALAANDAAKFRRAAHSLKTNSHTFGATTLGAMARSLELGGLESARDGVAMEMLSVEYTRVASELKRLCDG